MSITFLNVLIAITACLSSHNGVGSAMKIYITPSKAHRLVHHEVDLYCKLEQSDTDVKEVMILELVKGDVPIAVIRQNSRLTTGRSLNSKFHAEGRISTSPIDSYLHVTLSYPDFNDSGPYTCLFYFKGDLTLVKESRRSANLTVYGSALNMDISPSKANGLVQHEVNIHCSMEYSGTDVKQIKMMELTKGGETIVVMHNNSKITVGKDTESTFQAEGKLPAPPMESYLHLTLSNPDAKDSGTYTCVVYYTDDVPMAKESTKSGKLTVVDHDVESALTILLEKITRLKEIHAFDMALLNKELDKEKSGSLTNQHLIAGLEAALKTQKRVHGRDITQLKKGIEGQMSYLKEEQVWTTSLKTELNSMRRYHERDFFELKKDLEKQVNKTLYHKELISKLKTELKEKKSAHEMDTIRLKKELIIKQDGMMADQRLVSNLKEEVDALKDGHRKDVVQLDREIRQQSAMTSQIHIGIHDLKKIQSELIHVLGVHADELDSRLDQHGNVLIVRDKTLNDSISQLIGKVKEINKESIEQGLMLHHFNTRDPTVKKILLQLKQGQDSRTQKISEVFYKEKTPVLFRALKYENQNYTENSSTMLYPHVMAIEGGCYNAASGVFVAPVSGYYRFSLSAAANDIQYIYMDLTSSNGKALTTLYDGEYLGWMEYSETSVVTKLDAGEEIRPAIRTISPNFNERIEDYHDALKKFNGYLLKTL